MRHRAYSRPMIANCRSHSAVQSTVAPPSTRICGARPGTGTGTAIAGRATPRMRPMRRSAAAIAAPVLPALTIASALPSRTSSAETHDRGVLLGAHRRRRVVHRHDLGRRHDLDAVDAVGEQRRDHVLEPDEQHTHVELLGRLDRARDDLAGGVVAAHRVDGNGDGHGRPTRRRSPGGRRTSRSCRTRCAAA